MSEKSSGPLLAIDTSGPRLQLALAGGDFAHVLVEELAKGHAEVLFDRIGALLRQQQTEYAQLTRIAVTTGPGSFTGLRIGIAAARGLGLAQKLPVIGIPNLLALSLAAESGPVDICVDARRQECYAQRFTAPGVPESDAQLIDAEQASAFVRDGVPLLTDPQVDLGRLAAFALTADAAAYPPQPTYIRAADAKPQSGKQVARK